VYYQPQVPAMLLNRLSNFSFLPPFSSGSSSDPAAGAQPGVANEAGGIVGKRVGNSQAIELAKDAAAEAAQESVHLHLDSSAKAARDGTYTRAGVIPDPPSSLHKTPLTPAEEFVAAAVANLRNYDQAKINAANDALAKSGLNADGSPRSAFGSIKQAVFRLYASA
jgi:hypothetical protein